MRKNIKILALLFFAVIQHSFAQQKTNDKALIHTVIEKYSECVIKRDSVGFYDLFNGDNVIWCAAVKDRSHNKEIEVKGKDAAGNSYFTGSYKGFLRALFRHKSTEDKFDNVRITEDGTVASVTMDYSFWADNKMTNWGSKFLGLIKKDGQWKITSVIYSLELITYFAQPSLKEREQQNQ